MVKFYKDIVHQVFENEYSLEQNERTVNLFGLDLDTTENQIEDLFSAIDMKPLRIVKQSFSSFCYVTFESYSIVKFLLEKSQIFMNGKYVQVVPFSQSNNFDPNANLIIKNLESYLTETDIIEKFKFYGEILSCKLVRDVKGESKCYAYLQYKYRSSALDSIDNLNNTYWDEKYDPDYHYQQYIERLQSLKQNQHMGMIVNFYENDILAELSKKKLMHHGKKIYVGIFKKRDEYYKIKKEKEGKPSNLYVKNFGPNFGDRDLFNLFKSFGSIKSAKVRRQKLGLVEKPLGCGFVDFEDPEEAEKARLALNGFALKETNRVISVTYADCKSRRMRKKLEESQAEFNSTEFLRQSPVNSYEYSMYSDIEGKSSDNETTLNCSFDLCNTDDDTLSNASYKLSLDVENRDRSVSTSSECSFEMILYDWSERWNRKVTDEYKLF